MTASRLPVILSSEVGQNEAVKLCIPKLTISVSYRYAASSAVLSISTTRRKPTYCEVTRASSPDNNETYKKFQPEPITIAK